MTVTFTAIQKLLWWVSVGGGQVVKHPLQNYHWMVILERGLCLCHFFHFHPLKLDVAMKPLKEEETYVAEADYQSSMTLYTEM